MIKKAGAYQGNKGLEYYKAYPRDFFEGAVGMPGPLRGFYRMVIDLIYMHDGILLDDFHHISGHTGFGPTQCKRMMQQLIEQGKIELWAENRRYFVNKRAVSELKTSRKFQENQRNKAASRWENNGLTDNPASSPAIPKGIPPQDHKTTRLRSPSDSSFQNDLIQIHEPEPKPKKNQPTKPMRFDEFWNAYPKRNGVRTGKAEALAKYKIAIKSGITENELIKAAEAFAKSRKALDNFAPDPARWLNKKGWQDDIEPDNTNRAQPNHGGGSRRPPNGGIHDAIYEGFAQSASERENGSRQDGFDRPSLFPSSDAKGDSDEGDPDTD